MVALENGEKEVLTWQGVDTANVIEHVEFGEAQVLATAHHQVIGQIFLHALKIYCKCNRHFNPGPQSEYFKSEEVGLCRMAKNSIWQLLNYWSVRCENII